MEHGQYRKNDVVTLTIEDIGSDGEGIGKSDGYTLFVRRWRRVSPNVKRITVMRE